MSAGFDVVAEIDGPHRLDLEPVRRQVADLAPLTDHVLAPDNPTARAATGPWMAEGVASAIPDLELPAGLEEALADDPDARVAAACEHALAVREAGVVDGVRLVAVSRAGRVARRPAPLLAAG
ncbi:MAG TPA: hypothetical protein VGH76_03595 [Actinomycetospora sp.]|uniref:hypothetical protein n=1 Tax=Actinomycetospora sp. TaxID=1872135 RepID=UPI002F3FCCF9